LTRQFTLTDQVCNVLDQGLRTVFTKAVQTRINPAATVQKDSLTEIEKKQAAGLMRVNHVGEVCAQALYQGQALTARTEKIKQAMRESADEEVDHLAWCESRLQELNSHTSYLNPIWFLGSLTLGLAAGFAGDKWSLGFVAETEKQVVKHLESHLDKLPKHDAKSRAIITMMRDDEEKHAHKAIAHGASDLPKPVQRLMAVTAKLMTSTAYYL